MFTAWIPASVQMLPAETMNTDTATAPEGIARTSG